MSDHGRLVAAFTALFEVYRLLVQEELLVNVERRIPEAAICAARRTCWKPSAPATCWASPTPWASWTENRSSWPRH